MGEMICQRGTAMSDVENLKKPVLPIQTEIEEKCMGDMICTRGTAMSDVEIKKLRIKN